MSKIAINNEIVLMRQAVRQTRVIVVRKLIKEAKLLQGRKHGDEKTQEKYKRKVQRLIAEIEAIKKIKDDEISKFGITNTRHLQDVLNDTTTEPATRIMTRLIFHKILADRIAKFKEKFPEYEEHLGPGRKKLSKLQRQANREARNAMKRNPGINSETVTSSVETTNSKNNVDENVNEFLEKSSDEEEENVEDSDETEPENDDIEDEENAESAKDKIDEAKDDKDAEAEESLTSKYNLEPGSILRIQTPSCTAKKRKNKDPIISQEDYSTSEISEKRKNKVESKKEKKIKTKVTSETTKDSSLTNIPSEPKKSKPIKVISKEATVKRFTDLIDETETEEIVQEINTNKISRKNDMKIEKEVDSFFMTENGDREYLSVVVPKSKLCENDEQDVRFSQNHAAMRQKNFHERNNKFFSKIDQRSNSHDDKYAPNAGRQRSNNFTNGRGQSEKFSRIPTGPVRNSRPQIERKIEATEEHLHPSWAAKKKQQEILKQGFQGKKIVFDD